MKRLFVLTRNLEKNKTFFLVIAYSSEKFRLLRYEISPVGRNATVCGRSFCKKHCYKLNNDKSAFCLPLDGVCLWIHLKILPLFMNSPGLITKKMTLEFPEYRIALNSTEKKGKKSSILLNI